MVWSAVPVIVGDDILAAQYNDFVAAYTEKRAVVGGTALSTVTAGTTALLASQINTARSRLETMITETTAPHFVDQATIAADGASNFTLAALLTAYHGVARTNWTTTPSRIGALVEAATLSSNITPPYIEHINELRGVLDQLIWVEALVSAGSPSESKSNYYGVDFATEDDAWADAKLRFPGSVGLGYTGLAGRIDRDAVGDPWAARIYGQWDFYSFTPVLTPLDFTLSIPGTAVPAMGATAEDYGGTIYYGDAYEGTQWASVTIETGRQLVYPLEAGYAAGYIYVWTDTSGAGLDLVRPPTPGVGENNLRGCRLIAGQIPMAWIRPDWTYVA